MIGKLGKFCQFLNGGTPSKEVSSYFEGDIPWITSADITGPIANKARSFITEDAIKNSATNKVAKGTVLLVTRTSVGKVAVAGQDLCFSQDITAILPDASKLDSGYLVQFLKTKQGCLERLARGATIKGVTREVVAGLEIPLPPIAEQRRMAAILDQADALRAKRREALDQLDSLTQSIFIEMFGDPLVNSRGWQTRPLLKICDAINDCPHSTPGWTEEGEICLRTSNLTEGGWCWDDTRYVSEATYHERSKRGYVVSGDIVLSREGTVGIAAIVMPDMKVCMGQRLVQVRPSPSVLVSEFLLRYLLFALSPKRIGQIMVGSTSQHLNVKALKALRVLLPPIELQREFARRVVALKTLKNAAIDTLVELDALFASLQHRAFRGEL